MASQWLSLVGTIWLQTISGTNTDFPAYSSQLKKTLAISQLQLNNLALASDAGKLLGWVSGIVAASFPLWLVLLIGACLGLFAYGIQYLLVTDQIPSVMYWHVFCLTILAGNSVCWINTACYIVAIKNFPLDRQIAVGLSTSYVGLSAKIYSNIVGVADPGENSVKSFLLLNAILPLIVCLVAAPVVRDVDGGKSRKLAAGFTAMFCITILTGVFAVITSLGFVSWRPLVVLIGMAVFLVLPVAVPVTEKIKELLQQKCAIRVHDVCSSVNKQDGGSIPTLCVEKIEGANNVIRPCLFVEFEDIGAREMLKRVEFWLYFFVYLFGATLGLVYLNNLGQIAESRGCLGTSLVSLSSSFSFFGRLIPSLFDYFFFKSKYMISRPAFMASMMIPMSGSFFLLLNKNDSSLYISTAIIGVSTGAITSISVSTTTELFGPKNFGVNHNILVSNIPIGSFIFGDFAAMLYSKAKSDGEANCMGQKCYQTTFIIWGTLCFIGVLLAFALHARTKRVFSHKF